MIHSHNEVQFVQIGKKRLLVTELSFLKYAQKIPLETLLWEQRGYMCLSTVTKTMDCHNM